VTLSAETRRRLGPVVLACAVLACGRDADERRPSASPPPPAATATRHRPLPASPPAAGPDAFSCGPTACDARTHYCELVNTDVQELPSDWACKPLPSTCVPAAHGECGCFPVGTRCARYCRRVDTRGARGFLLTCIGGG
jgi:hypothetical protein